MDEARAREVLAAAKVVPEAGQARLLALGENAVFAAGDLVVKVGRDADLLDRARRELDIARWLAEAGVPAVRAAEPEPLMADGHPVTVWHRLPDAVRPAEPRDLAALLRIVHALPAPPVALPPRELLGGVERWLRLAGDAIDPADAAYLREHDLVVMALSRDRYGLPADAYDAFTAAYGWDVREWEGCAVLRGARETASCAWVAQHAPSNPKARAEFRRRVDSLREGDTTVRWYPF